MKQKWIFIRGLAREKSHWGSFVEEFQMRHPDAEVLLLDLKGNGETFKESTPTSVEEMCEDLRMRSQSFRENKSVNILSVSLGAMVALDWASRYPQEMNQVVAVNTSSSLSRFYKRLKLSAIPKLLKAVIAQSFEQKENFILSLVAPHALQKKPHLVQQFARVQSERPVHWLNFIRQLWAARKMRLAKSAPSVEVILINSLGDLMVDPSCTLDIASLWGLGVQTHPWGGHDLPLEDGAWLIDKMTHVRSV